MIIISVFLIFLSATIYFTLRQTPIYRAMACIKIDQQKQVLSAMTDMLRLSSTGESISTEIEYIQSQEVLEIVAGKLKLFKPSATEIERFNAVADLQNRVKAQRTEGTSIIKINVESSSSKNAADTANTIAETYMILNHENKISNMRESNRFIDQQLGDSRNTLSISENELKNYKEKNGTLSVDSQTQLTKDKLGSFESELLALDNEKENLDWQIEQIEKQIKNGDIESIPVNGAMQSPAMQNTHEDMLAVRKQISGNLQYWTDQNPELIELRKKEKYLAEIIRIQMIASLNQQKGTLLNQKHNLSVRYEQVSNLIKRELKTVPETDLQLSRHSRDVAFNEDLYSMLNRESKEGQIKERAIFNDVKIVTKAIPPNKPIRPNKPLNITIGAFLGIFIGIMILLIVEMGDTSFFTIEEVEDLIGKPVLSAIPHFSNVPSIKKQIPFFGRKQIPEQPIRDFKTLMPTVFKPLSPETESYKHLRTALRVSRKGESRSILFSSSGPQEGKSITIVNTAIVMAQKGHKTLLVSSNLRRPSICKKFGIEREFGLSDVLQNRKTLEEVIKPFSYVLENSTLDWSEAPSLDGLDNLYILTSGAHVIYPTELLESEKMTETLAELKKQFDVVLIDAPPILPVTDSLIIGALVDSTVIVYQIGRLPRHALMRTLNLLAGLEIKVDGIIINNVGGEFQNIAPYYISYKYYSSSKEKEKVNV